MSKESDTNLVPSNCEKEIVRNVAKRERTIDRRLRKIIKIVLCILSSVYVGGHAAIEVKIGGKDIFYFDNGWWGHIFTPTRIPFYVRRHL